MFKVPTQLPLPQLSTTAASQAVNLTGNLTEIISRGAAVANDLVRVGATNTTVETTSEKWHHWNGWGTVILCTV